MEERFHDPGASLHCFPPTTRTAQVHTAESPWYNEIFECYRVTMMDQEAPIEHRKRLKHWWNLKKWRIRYLWRKKKRLTFKRFPHSQVSLWYDKVRKSLPMYHKPNLPELTLSALDETGHAELTIPVPKQQSYTCNKPVISSALADTPCADLGMDGVLEKLNDATLGTSYSAGSKVLHPWRRTTLYSIMEPYIARNDDFGTVYAHLRGFWYDYNVGTIEVGLCAAEEKDREMLKRVLVHDRIASRAVPPSARVGSVRKSGGAILGCDRIPVGDITCMGGQE
ncbi:hypothetical protein EDD18DRAFT_1469346 [Armillaria luteobubalina]|uniref:Uncharacterized protein n=1 Tax=Armillaria luteobubalina TaxID=153913 RepID=A0AA39P4M1_9AGAR|nr:hypothetical protein EDD18DRAFT_1469346 [Armillaria luteobubalina]